ADELIGGNDIASFRRQGQPASDDWACALLAGLQLREIGIGGISSRPRTRAILDRVAGWIAESLPVHPDEGGMPAVSRAWAGDILDGLGDPRFDPQHCHLPADETLGFVRIPADLGFRIGVRKADADRVARLIGHDVPAEVNDEPTPTDEFWIARYPVTVGQFRDFVEATRFELGDADAMHDPDNRPVRNVSWHEALDYCAWLNDRLAGASEFDGNELSRRVREQGWRVMLPSELEWEKAARGGLPNCHYPWGDEADPERANYRETGIGDTSAVGCFAPNGYGPYDMAGNVYEWTRSCYAPYLYRSDDGRESMLAADDERVVRGGSWDTHRDYARCACRYGLHPGDRNRLLGFRVVLRSAPVS
ncbi:MAG: formylglycine-generating enzyme family protein, partial [Candidatus Methylophosphatis roskildensis]